ncbi:MAG TPA: indolepyruvate oxidoreductase subunit beta family protein [Caldimonas sp.]
MTPMDARPDRPVAILVCALGGEGGGVLAEWLVDTAIACGHAVQSTSIPGVAQRTGATTYYVEIFPRPSRELGGRRPVFSLNPVPGAIDLLVSSELLETVRQIGNGMATRERTQVISSDSRALTTAEKMQLGDGRASSDALLGIVREHSLEAQVFDMAALARQCGTAISAVLLGAIAGSGALPFPHAAFEQTIRRAGIGVESSLRGFAEARERVTRLRAERAAVHAAVAALVAAPAAAPDAALDRFPAPVREMVALGHARMLDYQDASYAQLYLDRLGKVLAAERAGDPDGANGWATTRATARYLALWMAFDDIVRVAHLKCRAARLARVRSEVKAGDADLLRVYDHFKPGVPEFAALLPASLADRLTRWDRRRIARGRPPFALPLKIGTHTVLGALALRTLASLKGLRRRGSRFAFEQSMIERWLAAIERGAREHGPLGHEIAVCGRLVKGYGATNERGKDNLLHVIDHLAPAAPARGAAARAAAIRSARTAALADDAGIALDKSLLLHGAPPRPLKEQPIQWVRARPGGAANARGM